VKREAFIRELKAAGCALERHGTRHDIWRNPATGRQASVPRHRELSEVICAVIRKQLGHPRPRQGP
jgi:hypothetical protein